MDIQKRITAFARLGAYLKQLGTEEANASLPEGVDEQLHEEVQQAIADAPYYNGWFTKENIQLALSEWSKALEAENLQKWLEPYQNGLKKVTPRTVAVIMAGNIPLVGFHDFLCVLISGHRLKAKLSSDDRQLIPVFYKVLKAIEPEFEGKVDFTDRKVENVDAIIATGSNNSARYFEYYFSKYPHVIRKNRNGVAVLTGHESEDEMHALGKDIFRYFGLGCRNVSKLFVPAGYNFDPFFKGIYGYHDQVIHHNKYANNYDYYKAIYLLNKESLTENGFLLLKEDTAMGSPVSVMFFEYYNSDNQLLQRLGELEDAIQCTVSTHAAIENAIAFGTTQQPQLWDYADGVDTMDFLLKLDQGTNS